MEPTVKLPFVIINVSSSDEGHGPDQLLPSQHNPHAKGWQCAKFAKEPHELILQINSGQPVHLRQIQILSHHYKIATRCDIYTALSSDRENVDWDVDRQHSIVFTKLGYVTLDDNIRSSFQARELKTIHLNVYCDLVKLVLYRCHINELNVYNQVGLVAINVLGIPTASHINVGTETEVPVQEPILYTHDLNRSIDRPLPVMTPTGRSPPNHMSFNASLNTFSPRSSVAPAPESLAFDIYHDQEIALLIRAFLRAKEIAINKENYQHAKIIKTILELLQKVAAEVAKLDLSKKRAVENEDFDAAELIKRDIHQLKNAAEQKIRELGFAVDAHGQVLVLERESIPQLAPRQIDSIVVDRPRSAVAPLSPVNVLQPFVPLSMPAQETRILEQTVKPSPVQPRSLSVSRSNVMNIETPLDASEQSLDAALRASHASVVDARPLPALQKKNRNATSVEALVVDAIDQVPQFDKMNDLNTLPSLAHQRETIEVTESLSDALLKENALAIESFGLPTITDLFAKQFTVQQGAMQHIVVAFDKISPSLDALVLASGTCQVISIAFADHREKMFMMGVACWQKLEVYIQRKRLWPNVFKFIEPWLPHLLIKASDNNLRMKKAAIEVLLALSKLYTSGSTSMYPILLRIMSKSPPPKLIRGRLDIICAVLHENGLSIGWQAENVVSFAVPYLNHTNGDVRESAVQCLGLVYKLAGGNKVEPYLNDIKPQLIESIREAAGVASVESPEPIRKVLRDPETVARSPKPLSKAAVTPGSVGKQSTSTPAKSKESKSAKESPKKETTKGESESYTADNYQDEAKSPDLGNAVSKYFKNLLKRSNKSNDAPVKKADQKNDSAKLIVQEKESHEDDLLTDNESVLGNTCLFCDEKQDGFDEAALDSHYFSECPMLCTCPLCNQLKEIPSLTDHMLYECEGRSRVKQCLRCGEAIERDVYNQHCRQCTAIPNESRQRCPLCHKDIAGGPEQLKQHYIGSAGCPMNTRRIKVHRKQ